MISFSKTSSMDSNSQLLKNFKILIYVCLFFTVNLNKKQTFSVCLVFPAMSPGCDESKKGFTFFLLHKSGKKDEKRSSSQRQNT